MPVKDRLHCALRLSCVRRSCLAVSPFEFLESRLLGLGEAGAHSGAVRCGVMDVWVSSPRERKTKEV